MGGSNICKAPLTIPFINLAFDPDEVLHSGISSAGLIIRTIQKFLSRGSIYNFVKTGADIFMPTVWKKRKQWKFEGQHAAVSAGDTAALYWKSSDLTAFGPGFAEGNICAYREGILSCEGLSTRFHHEDLSAISALKGTALLREENNEDDQNASNAFEQAGFKREPKPGLKKLCFRKVTPGAGSVYQMSLISHSTSGLKRRKSQTHR